MRRKIHAARIMQKSQKTYRIVQTAGSQDFLTGFAPHADNIKARLLQRQLKIGVDLMGNDNDPHLLTQALKNLSLPKNLKILAIGTEKYRTESIEYLTVPEYINMEENPLKALRKKKNASIPTGLRLLKEGKIDAFVSAGNTGALVSSAKMILSTMTGILRPCLLTLMPTKKDPIAVLDVGANIQAKEKHLVQFAQIGAAYQKVRGIKNPKIGLLNIGSEAMKGTNEIRGAYHQLLKMDNFSGNIEGKTVFNGDVDVLVTDGFTGNIFLKTAEGIASLILEKIKTSPNDIQEFQSLSYAEYPGALLAGVRGVVIKCHGYSTVSGFINAVIGAFELAKEGFVQKLLNELK